MLYTKQREVGLAFSGEFRLRLVNARLQEEARARHPEWFRKSVEREAIVEDLKTYDSGWLPNVVTDHVRKRMVSSSFSAGRLFIHESVAPATVQRNALQFIYPNQTPNQVRSPDSSSLDLILQLQTRTVQYPPPSATGTGDTITAGSPVTLTDAAGLFSRGFVGNTVTITGATNAANNGTFPIVTFISPTQIQYTNAAAVNETTSFTWSAGVTRMINIVGVTFATAVEPNETAIHSISAYTKLTSTAVQTGLLAADLQYRVSFSLD